MESLNVCCKKSAVVVLNFAGGEHWPSSWILEEVVKLFRTETKQKYAQFSSRSLLILWMCFENVAWFGDKCENDCKKKNCNKFSHIQMWFPHRAAWCIVHSAGFQPHSSRVTLDYCMFGVYVHAFCVCVGSLIVLWFPHTSKNMSVERLAIVNFH